MSGHINSPADYFLRTTAAFYSSLYHAPAAFFSSPETCQQIRSEFDELQTSIEEKLQQINKVLEKEQQALEKRDARKINQKAVACGLAQKMLGNLSDILKLEKENKRLAADNWYLRIQHSYGEEVSENSENLINYIKKSVLPLVESTLSEELGPEYLDKLISDFQSIQKQAPSIKEINKDAFLWKEEPEKDKPNYNWLDARSALSASLIFTAYTAIREAGIVNAIFLFISAIKSFFKNPRLNILKQYQTVLDNIKNFAQHSEVELEKLKSSIAKIDETEATNHKFEVIAQSNLYLKENTEHLQKSVDAVAQNQIEVRIQATQHGQDIDKLLKRINYLERFLFPLQSRIMEELNRHIKFNQPSRPLNLIENMQNSQKMKNILQKMGYLEGIMASVERRAVEKFNQSSELPIKTKNKLLDSSRHSMQDWRDILNSRINKPSPFSTFIERRNSFISSNLLTIRA